MNISFVFWGKARTEWRCRCIDHIPYIQLASFPGTINVGPKYGILYILHTHLIQSSNSMSWFDISFRPHYPELKEYEYVLPIYNDQCVEMKFYKKKHWHENLSTLLWYFINAWIEQRAHFSSLRMYSKAKDVCRMKIYAKFTM